MSVEETKAPDSNHPAGNRCRLPDGRKKDIDFLDYFSSAVATVVETISPAVVGVAIMGHPPGADPSQAVAGSASGIVIAPDGYVLTNSHVVLQAEAVKVDFGDGTPHDAQVVGNDPATDLAVVRVNASGLTYATLGDSTALCPGQFVLAIGNPLGFQSTVSTGVVSSVGRGLRSLDGRLIEDVIQHTAALNPGSSGGPLVNSHAEVIGINTAIIYMAQGIGFSIPSTTARRIISQLIMYGHVRRGYLGIAGATRPVDRRLARFRGVPNERGVEVVGLDPGGPGYAAGLRLGDIIVQIGERRTDSVDDLHSFLTEWPIDKRVPLTVLRRAERVDLDVTPAEAPQKEFAAPAGGGPG